MSEKSVQVRHIVPYSSDAKFSDNATVSPTNSSAAFARKESPRMVRFVAGSGRKTKKKTRGMR